MCAAAIESLSTQDAHASLEPILAHVADPDWFVRKAVIRALSAAREEAPLEPIVAALGDVDPRVREAAARGINLLYEWHGARVLLAPLVAALGDEEVSVRETVLDVLANHPQYAPIEPVVAALGDPNPYVRCAALLVLEHMGRDRVPEEVDRTLQEMSATEPHVNARKYAVKTLIRRRLDAADDQDQQLDQAINDLCLPMLTERCQIGITGGVRVTAQFIERVGRSAVPVQPDDGGRDVSKQVSRQGQLGQDAQFIRLKEHAFQPDGSWTVFLIAPLHAVRARLWLLQFVLIEQLCFLESWYIFPFE